MSYLCFHRCFLSRREGYSHSQLATWLALSRTQCCDLVSLLGGLRGLLGCFALVAEPFLGSFFHCAAPSTWPPETEVIFVNRWAHLDYLNALDAEEVNCLAFATTSLWLSLRSCLMASTAGSSNPVLDTNSTRDSFIPLFNGQHSEYKEWRKRIKIYMMRMSMTKRGHEAILNLVGSLTGVAWKVAEAYDLDDVEKKQADEHFNKLLKLLDAAFEYDNRVQLPADFDRYFVHLQRRSGQSLLQYVTEHDECLRRLSDHKIDLPKAVQGWHLLRKAGLTREQKQLIMTQAPTLERMKVQEAMFLVLGQDHKAAVSDHHRRHF